MTSYCFWKDCHDDWCWGEEHRKQNQQKSKQEGVERCYNLSTYPAHARSALRALGLLLADGALGLFLADGAWGGGRLFDASTGFYYEKGHNSGTKSRKMKGLSEGYKPAVDQNWGCMAKFGFFGPKPRFRAQKKLSLLDPNHVLATTGKSCSNKKVAFSKINISLLINFGCFFGIKCFFPKKTLFGWTYKRPFLRNSGPDRVLCHSGSGLKTVQN